MSQIIHFHLYSCVAGNRDMGRYCRGIQPLLVILTTNFGFNL